MSNKSNKRSGFPGGGDNEDELLADFEAWDDNFGDLFAEPTGAGAQPGRASQPGARPAAAGQPRRPADEFEFELSLDDSPDADPEDATPIPGGPSGPAASRGPAGPAASRGPAGPAASRGPSGPAGPAVSRGPSGPAVSRGPAASRGPSGPAVARGPSGPAASTAARRPAEPDDELSQPQALGKLLGATSPIDIDDIDDGDPDASALPPPPFEQDSGMFIMPKGPVASADGFTGEDDGDEVLTSAKRPVRDSTVPAVAPRLQRGQRMRPGSVLDAFQPVPSQEDDEEFDPFGDPEEGSSSQVTKVVKVDESLLAAAVPEESARKEPQRRAPTIMRRDEIERLRAQRAARVDIPGPGPGPGPGEDEDEDEDEDGFGGRETQMLSSEQLESLAGETAPPAPPAPAVVAVDADFYDDIVIADSAAPEQEVTNEITPAIRRVSRHVVRRDTLQPLRDAGRPKPVLRPRSRRSRSSEQELASHRDATRNLDPESTLDLRLHGEAVLDAASSDAARGVARDEIQAIIDRAARELRSQRQETNAHAPVVLPPEEAEAAEEAFEDFELDWETEPETKPAAPSLAAAASAALGIASDELASIPGLPDPVLPTGDLAGWPALDLAGLAIPQAAVPLTPEGWTARGQELESTLMRYRRDLAKSGEGAQTAMLHLEAGRLAERLGHLDQARDDYENALRHGAMSEAERGLVPALRGLRRIARAQGRWDDAVHALDRELGYVSAIEQRALRDHRIDLLMAQGDREMAGDTVIELGSDAGSDPRALLAELELALAEQRHADAARALGRLAESVAEPTLGSALARMRGIVEERLSRDAAGGDPGAAFMTAAQQGAVTALLAAAGEAQRTDDVSAARLSELVELSAAADGVVATAPTFAAALAWRRSLWAEVATRAAGQVDPDARWRALTEAAALAPGEAFLAAEAAAAVAARADHERAAALYRQLGANAPSETEQAAALARAARHLGARGQSAEAAELLARVQTLDPSSPAPALLLAPMLERAGDTEALLALDRQAVASDPEAALHERVRAARRLEALGRVDEAIAELEAGRALAPEATALQQALLETLRQAGRTHARAGLLATLADDAGPGLAPEVLLWRAAVAYEDHARSVALERGAGADAGDAAEPQRALRDGALAGALEAWNRVLDREPESPAAHVASVRLAALLGDPDVLDDALARAQAAVADPGHAAAMGLWRVALATGQPASLPAEDPELLDEVLRELAAVSPADPRPALTRAVLAAVEGRFADAATAYEDRATALGQGPPATALRYRAAGLYLDAADDAAPAAALLEDVLRAVPGLVPAQELLRTARLRMGELTGPNYLDEQAADTGNASAAMRGAGEDAFARLVREADASLAHHGDPVRALELYDKALALRPDDPRAWTLLGHGLLHAAEEAGAFDRLVETVDQVRARAQARGAAAAQADAHEDLARIEERLRLDPEAALEQARAALAADPGLASAQRMLERAYLQAQRWDELRALYAGVTPASDREAAALALAEAHLIERLPDRPQAAALAAYARAQARDPRCRPAVFHLEAAARSALVEAANGEHDAWIAALETLGAAEQAAAALFDGDALARAAFLTRAGESALERAALEDAVALFREADEVVRGEDAPDGEAMARGPRGYGAALFGWRTAALRGSLWLDVAEAAQREARLPEATTGATTGAATGAASERVALHHLAGVALMDRGLDGEHARTALHEVLAIEPLHDDAFARMRVLLEEQGEHDHLAELVAARLAHETEPVARAWLHRELALLSRNFLGDRDGARQHWREVLALVPGAREAITALADLAWELGDWQEAATELARRVRIETDNDVRKHIFFRLGTIYAERLPDPDMALKAFKQVLRYDPSDAGALDGIVRLGAQSGDHQIALAACERLVRAATEPEAKVPHLHRMAEIYQKSMRDPARAERAYRTALDLVPTSDVALSALVGFYEQRGDLRSTRVHLDRLAASMRARVAENPADGVAYRVIARAMAARDKAGIEGSLAPARCAAELALRCDAGDQRDRDLVALPLRGLAGLGAPDADEYLYPAVVSDAVRQLFGRLGDRLAKHVGADLRRYDVGRGQRLRERESPALAAAEAVASELGVEAPVLYVSDKHARVLAIEPTEPISLILGAELAAELGEPELRFVAGRALAWARTGLAVPARMSADEFTVFLVALLRQFEPGLDVPGVDAAAVEAEAQKLRRVISGGLVQELRAFALGVTGDYLDPAKLWAGIVEVGNRGGLLASGSIEAAIHVLDPRRGERDLAAALADPEIAALVRFAISNEHAQLRAMLGKRAG
jgi:Flp pilus assembly protein TadD